MAGIEDLCMGSVPASVREPALQRRFSGTVMSKAKQELIHVPGDAMLKAIGFMVR